MKNKNKNKNKNKKNKINITSLNGIEILKATPFMKIFIEMLPYKPKKVFFSSEGSENGFHRESKYLL